MQMRFWSSALAYTNVNMAAMITFGCVERHDIIISGNCIRQNTFMYSTQSGRAKGNIT